MAQQIRYYLHVGNRMGGVDVVLVRVRGFVFLDADNFRSIFPTLILLSIARRAPT